jgi:CHASE1-domain containing sensor protein
MKNEPRNAAPFAVLAVFVLITLGATKYVWDSSRLAERARFDLTVRTTVDAIEDRVAVYSDVLRAAAGLFAAAQDVTRDQFRAYVRHLQVQSRYPGIQGIGISLRVKPEMVEAVVHDLRANEFPEFDIWPEDPREEYFPIVLLEPLDRRNRAAVGYDMYTDPSRRAAMQRARDTGEAAATARVTLVQEIDSAKQPGFLLYVPIYSTAEVPQTLRSGARRSMGSSTRRFAPVIFCGERSAQARQVPRRSRFLTATTSSSRATPAIFLSGRGTTQSRQSTWPAVSGRWSSARRRSGPARRCDARSPR